MDGNVFMAVDTGRIRSDAEQKSQVTNLILLRLDPIHLQLIRYHTG